MKWRGTAENGQTTWNGQFGVCQNHLPFDTERFRRNATITLIKVWEVPTTIRFRSIDLWSKPLLLENSEDLLVFLCLNVSKVILAALTNNLWVLATTPYASSESAYVIDAFCALFFKYSAFSRTIHCLLSLRINIQPHTLRIQSKAEKTERSDRFYAMHGTNAHPHSAKPIIIKCYLECAWT